MFGSDTQIWGLKTCKKHWFLQIFPQTEKTCVVGVCLMHSMATTFGHFRRFCFKSKSRLRWYSKHKVPDLVQQLKAVKIQKFCHACQDRMLDMGFEPQIRKNISGLPKDSMHHPIAKQMKQPCMSFFVFLVISWSDIWMTCGRNVRLWCSPPPGHWAFADWPLTSFRILWKSVPERSTSCEPLKQH